MNHENMWNTLKAGIMEKVDNKTLDASAHEAYLRVLTDMTRIETEEYAKSQKAGTEKSAEYTVKQDILGNVDIKAPFLEKSARELFRHITGHKVIDSLEELESEMQKRKGKAPFSDQEPIVVDNKVEIPKHIWDEANVRGIRIARFGVDIIGGGGTQKGIFVDKGFFHDVSGSVK